MNGTKQKLVAKAIQSMNTKELSGGEFISVHAKAIEQLDLLSQCIIGDSTEENVYSNLPEWFTMIAEDVCGLPTSEYTGVVIDGVMQPMGCIEFEDNLSTIKQMSDEERFTMGVVYCAMIDALKQNGGYYI